MHAVLGGHGSETSGAGRGGGERQKAVGNVVRCMLRYGLTMKTIGVAYLAVIRWTCGCLARSVLTAVP